MKSPVVGIAYKEGFCAFSASKPGLNDTKGIFTRLLNEVSKRNLSVEFAPAGIDDISIILEEGPLAGKVSEIKHALRDTIDEDSEPYGGRATVHFHDNLACIVIAGKGISRNRHVAPRIQETLLQHRIPVFIESRGIENRCLIYIVPQEEGREAAIILHDLFFS